jgi:glutathione S-transferase
MSLPILVIGTKNLSSWSLRAWLALKHLGIEFEELELPLDTPEYDRRIEEYSPTRRVPAFIDGNLRIWDSLAICEHANDLAGGKGWPSDQRERALARAISAEMHSGFSELRTCWPMNALGRGLTATLSEGAAADIVRIQRIWQDCRQRFSASGPWLFGSYSIADAMYAPIVLRFQSYGAKLNSIAQQYSATALSDPHLQAWIESSRTT